MKNKWIKYFLFSFYLLSLGFLATTNSAKAAYFEIGTADVPSVKGLWHFHQNSSDTTQYGNDLIKHGTLNFSTGTPSGLDTYQIGVLSGTNYMATGSIGTVDGGWAVSAWVNLNGNTDGAYFFEGTDIIGTHNGFGLGFGNGVAMNSVGSHLMLYNTEIDYIDFGAMPSMSGWHFILVQQLIASATVRAYVDGTLLGSGAKTLGNITAEAETDVGVTNSSTASLPAGNNFNIAELAFFQGEFSEADITSIWNSGNGKQFCLGTGCSSGLNIPVLDFIYPNSTNASETIRFTPWLIGVSDLMATTSYKISVHTTYETLGTFSDNSSVVYGMTSGVVPVVHDWISPERYAQIVCPDFDCAFEATSTAYIYYAGSNTVLSSTTQHWLLSVPITGASGSELIVPTSTAGVLSTSTIPVAAIVPATTTAVACIKPDFADLGGGITYAGCQLGTILFSPGQAYVDQLKTSFENFKSVPPFSVYFDILRAVSSSIDAYNANTDSGVTLVVKGMRSENVTLVNLNSENFYNFENSSTASATAHTAMDNLSGWIEAMLWVSCILALIYIIKKS